MQYISTRGQMPAASFTQVLLDGLAGDGGLVVPAEIPNISADTLESWRQLSYPELAFQIIRRYATDIPDADLQGIVNAAYATKKFQSHEIVPLTKIDENLCLVGLSEGPTLAFKDLAMQFLGEVMPYVLAKTNRTINILGATSGDTGSAAEEAFRGKPGINVFMLSPQGRMSDIQRAQMYTIDDENIHNLAISGVFDDCQNLVKDINADSDFKQKYSIGAVNSINFGRITAQIVYYFWAWLRATDAKPQAELSSTKVSISVPSGNFGNVYSGHLAKAMGLPIHRLIVATNENNVLEEFFRTGIYAPRQAADTLATSSPSMDISKASNLERFIWELVGSDNFLAVWGELASNAKIDLSAYRSALVEKYGFLSSTSNHKDRVATIKSLFDSTGIVIDPHTADGLYAAYANPDPDHVTLILQTAKPDKFPETVAEALANNSPQRSADLTALLAKPQLVTKLPNDLAAVQNYIETNA